MVIILGHFHYHCFVFLSQHGYHFVWRRHENMSPFPRRRVNSNYELHESKSIFEREPQNIRHLPPPIVMSNFLTTGTWSICHKTDWHRLKSINNWTQQRVHSEQERFWTGLLTPWIINYIQYNVYGELIYPFATFNGAIVVSSHTILSIWLLIRAGIKTNHINNSVQGVTVDRYINIGGGLTGMQRS